MAKPRAGLTPAAIAAAIEKAKVVINRLNARRR